jgi:hypothetical protein
MFRHCNYNHVQDYPNCLNECQLPNCHVEVIWRRGIQRGLSFHDYCHICDRVVLYREVPGGAMVCPDCSTVHRYFVGLIKAGAGPGGS